MPNIPRLNESVLSQPIETGAPQMSLDEINGVPPIPLSDLAGTKSPDGPVPPPVPSDGEINNTASSLAVMSGDQENVVQNYLDMSNEYKTTGFFQLLTQF